MELVSSVIVSVIYLTIVGFHLKPPQLPPPPTTQNVEENK